MKKIVIVITLMASCFVYGQKSQNLYCESDPGQMSVDSSGEELGIKEKITKLYGDL